MTRSLGKDPRYHEELRKSPEIKIHIRKVVFRVSEKFGNFPAGYRKVSRRFRKVPRWDPPTLGPTWTEGVVQQPTWAGRTMPQGPRGIGRWGLP